MVEVGRGEGEWGRRKEREIEREEGGTFARPCVALDGRVLRNDVVEPVAGDIQHLVGWEVREGIYRG